MGGCQRNGIDSPSPRLERRDGYAMLIECVRRTIETYAMVSTRDRVLVAVSGGADSVCLLDLLRQLGYELEVAHFDHETRGGESHGDAAFVQDLAQRWSLPCHCERRAVRAESEAARSSFEEYARKVRYGFLVRAARDSGCAVIATGHHADDQAETVLMRLLRGTSPRGLAGIPPVGAREGVRIIRPLFDCTREEIVAYVEAAGLPYRVDRTNADTAYERNRIRHELLPLLAKDYNPRAREALVRLAELVRSDNDLLDSLAASAEAEVAATDDALSRAPFARLHPALQRRVVARLAWRHAVDCPFERVDAAVAFIAGAPTGRRFDLGGGLLLYNGREATELVSVPEETDDAEVALSVPGTTRAFDRCFEVVRREVTPAANVVAHCSPERQVFDADALGGDLAVRRRRPGDRFGPLGMTGTKSLKKYLIEIGVPAPKRDRQLVLTGGGRIAWVVGHAISAHAAVSAATQAVLEVKVSDETEWDAPAHGPGDPTADR